MPFTPRIYDVHPAYLGTGPALTHKLLCNKAIEDGVLLSYWHKTCADSEGVWYTHFNGYLCSPEDFGRHENPLVDTSHLVALTEGLSRERSRLAESKTDGERKVRSVWIAQREREIACEMEFLGMTPNDALPVLSDDELLAALEA